jgi:hypothetical protein
MKGSGSESGGRGGPRATRQAGPPASFLAATAVVAVVAVVAKAQRPMDLQRPRNQSLRARRGCTPERGVTARVCCESRSRAGQDRVKLKCLRAARPPGAGPTWQRHAECCADSATAARLSTDRSSRPAARTRSPHSSSALPLSSSASAAWLSALPGRAVRSVTSRLRGAGSSPGGARPEPAPQGAATSLIPPTRSNRSPALNSPPCPPHTRPRWRRRGRLGGGGSPGLAHGPARSPGCSLALGGGAAARCPRDSSTPCPSAASPGSPARGPPSAGPAARPHTPAIYCGFTP